MIHPPHLRQLVIRPALRTIGLWSQAAENLLVLTALVESRGGTYLAQIGRGPALGIFQMEPATHDWLMTEFLLKHEGIRDRILLLVQRPIAETMIFNLRYAAAMARVRYFADPQPLPDSDDLHGLASYWKRVYNTHRGKGEIRKAITSYKNLENYA